MKSSYLLSIRIWFYCCLISFFIPINFCYSAGLLTDKSSHLSSNEKHSDGLFKSDEILKLTILSDFSSIMKDRGDDRSYHKGQLYYIDLTGDTIRRKIKLKTRGNFRRNPENCKYPPIRIKFSKLRAADSIFTHQSKLKLVTQCQLENYVLLEYLAYRMYNKLTDYSYRVRLAHITYADVETKEAHFTRYAFIIESEEELVSRINAEIYKPNVVQYFLVREATITMAMFQYMIGNDDWYVTSKHNTTILQFKETGNIIAVPYDFDFSYLVNAEYTKPEGASNKFIKRRKVYKGLCIVDSEYKQQVQLFNANKGYFMDLIEKLRDLPQKNKQESIKLINSFYKTIDKPSSLTNIFQKEECIRESIYKKK